MVAASEDIGPRARAKRDQILSGARRVFLRDGFAGASTDAIAAEARVSKRTLYAYYSSKEELFAEVMRRLTIENPQTRALESIEGMSPGDREELRRDLLELVRKIVTTMMQPDYLSLLRTTISDTHRFPQLGGLFRATVPERAMSGFAVAITSSTKRLRSKLSIDSSMVFDSILERSRTSLINDSRCRPLS